MKKDLLKILRESKDYLASSSVSILASPGLPCGRWSVS